MVDAEGRQIAANANSNSDLFWASRGGGGGSFGIATSFRFETVEVPRVIVFEIDWVLPNDATVGLMNAWQELAPTAADEIASILYVNRRGKDTLLVRQVGQSVGGREELERWVEMLSRAAKPWSHPRFREQSIGDASRYYSRPAGSAMGFYDSRSDIVSKPLPAEAFVEMTDHLARSRPGALTVSCEALGGAVSRAPSDATAFPHRGDTSYLIQYSTEYFDPLHARKNRQDLSNIYSALRPAMFGAAYVNYPDITLKDWPRAYWQSNVERLKAIKLKYDPENLFRHGHSVPLP
jgi:FAD/FMN-containing dehydrogenase